MVVVLLLWVIGCLLSMLRAGGRDGRCDDNEVVVKLIDARTTTMS